MKELAIYGGTFAPVHNGHLRAVDSLLRELAPDKLLIIPTLIPPHKQIDALDSPMERLKMLHLAFGTHPQYGKKLFISEYELNSPPPSYTVNTLRHFTSPDVHITFLCGTDMFLTLEKWREPQAIFDLCTIAVMQRENDDKSASEKIASQAEFLKKEFGADIKIINAEPIEISSSDIRNGDDALRRRYLPEAVYEYVKENSLYDRNK